MTVTPVSRNSEGPFVIDFMEEMCRPSKTAGLLVLRDWQKQLLTDMFALAPNGLRQYRTAYIGMPRKNGKSTLGAALAVYGLFMDEEDGAEVYSVAGDRAQAGIVFTEAKAMIEAEPELAALAKVYRTHIEVPSRGAIYRVLSADAPRAQGLNPSMVIFDEVHVQPNEDLWTAMTQGSGTRRQPIVVAITTAGFDRDTLAWRLYEHGRRVASGETVDPTFFFRWWEPSDPNADYRDPLVWAEANPAYDDFLHKADFEAVVVNTPESQFRRFRLNQWTTTREAWLPHGAWDAIADRSRVVSPLEPIVIGFDGSWSGDSTAMIGCTLDRPHLFVIDSWERPIDDPSWTVDADVVESALFAAVKKYTVKEIAADPHEWRQQLQRWERAKLPIAEWPTNSLQRIVPACSEFYKAVLGKTISHDGDPRLARHIGNAVVKVDRWGARIVKNSSLQKIDLAVASVIGYDRASHHAGIKPYIRRSRVLVTQ
jgi:phage terminase large subunit-like protein